MVPPASSMVTTRLVPLKRTMNLAAPAFPIISCVEFSFSKNVQLSILHHHYIHVEMSGHVLQQPMPYVLQLTICDWNAKHKLDGVGVRFESLILPNQVKNIVGNQVRENVWRKNKMEKLTNTLNSKVWTTKQIQFVVFELKALNIDLSAMNLLQIFGIKSLKNWFFSPNCWKLRTGVVNWNFWQPIWITQNM